MNYLFYFLYFALLILVYIRYHSQIILGIGSEGFSNLKNVNVKVALDKELGLMHKKTPLKPKSGLLFNYDSYGLYTFWMKNTHIPLDIVCLDHNYKVVDIIKKMKPHSKKNRTCNVPFKHAIEMNSGEPKKMKISIGDTIELNYVDKI